MSTRTTRYLIAAFLALLCIIALLSGANNSGAIGFGPSKAESVSIGVIMQPTPLDGLPPRSQSPHPVSTREPGAHGITGNTPQTSTSDKNNSIQPTMMGAGPNDPAYTEADVRSFFAQRYANFGDPTVDGGPPQIMDIGFMTMRALQQKLDQPFNLQMSDQTLICYVELRGRFPYTHPYSPNADAWKPYLTRVAQIFDARTGNALMLVGLDDK